jgi:hypothetical protein
MDRMKIDIMKTEAQTFMGFQDVVEDYKVIPNSYKSQEEHDSEADPMWEKGYVYAQVTHSFGMPPHRHPCKSVYVKFTPPVLERLRSIYDQIGARRRLVSLYVSGDTDRGPILGGVSASMSRIATLFRTEKNNGKRFLDKKWCKFFRDVEALGRYGYGLHLPEQYELCTVWENIEEFHNRKISEDEARNHRETLPFREFFCNKLHLFQDCVAAHNAQVDCERKLNPDFAEREKRFNPTPGDLYVGSDPVLLNVAKMALNGDRLELPQNEMFKNYTQVKDVLLTAGFKYKKSGFESPKAKELLQRLLGGEKVNNKKKFQFFATCKDEVAAMQLLADVKEHHTVLEPSAGHGDLVEGIDKRQVQCFELFADNVAILEEKGYQVTAGDFLGIPAQPIYDRILANPPFTGNQDIRHIKHMYEFLKPGGRMVTIASTSWETGSQKAQKDFRRWLAEVGAEVTPIAAGAFKESGTSVATTMILINKES